MKKILAVILLFVLIFNICGCGTGKYKKYESLIIDNANDGINTKIDTDIWSQGYFVKENMADQTISVEGNNYTGSYKNSIVETMNSYTTDVYCDENFIEFGLRSDTGKLAYVNLMNKDFFNTEPYLEDVSNPKENAIILATEIAAKYVDDIKEYTVIIEEPYTRYKEKDGKNYEITYYIITFAKKINNYFSSDYISVKVTSKGNLASIFMGDIGVFDNITIDFDNITMDQSILSKVDLTYQDTELTVIQREIKDQKIVVTPEGYVCMYSEVRVNGINASNKEVDTGIRILTVLG